MPASAAVIKPVIWRYTPDDRFLVYCFRGGKRSRLWADNLRTIGFDPDGANPRTRSPSD